MSFEHAYARLAWVCFKEFGQVLGILFGFR